ncbi:MAG TPA: GNAT family N-acetyltransferase [Bacteroidota bacterium]|nr:GNAT family N-acetyltransferase [Bacteroidota bacterium]
MKITTREVTPSLWRSVEQLFGSNGACGGCWCQAWRIDKGESWERVKGATAKLRLRRGVRSGSIHGILAFDGSSPVGWCTFGPRNTFPRLNRARSLGCDDADRVWSIPCFFVARTHRQKGVAQALLSHAIASMRKRGAEVIEGYPVKPNKNGQYISAFSWTGTRSLFKNAGFSLAGNRGGSKERVRLMLD